MKEEGETLKKKACEKTEQETEALKALAQGKEEEAVSAVMKALLDDTGREKPEKKKGGMQLWQYCRCSESVSAH